MQLLCPASTVTRGNSNLLPLPSSLTLPWARPGATVPCPTPPGLGRARPRVPPPPPPASLIIQRWRVASLLINIELEYAMHYGVLCRTRRPSPRYKCGRIDAAVRTAVSWIPASLK